METIEILILEDEKPNADRLQRLLKSLPFQIEIVAVIDSVKQAIEWLLENKHPDLVMMDVRLSDGLSFDIFQHVDIQSKIIFTTAYDEYAVKAFRYNSIDYLLKPVEKDELNRALSSYQKENIKSSKQNIEIENLIKYIQPKDYRTRFLIPYRDGYKSILTSEISFIYFELNITYAKLWSGTTEIIPYSLEQLEQELNPKIFFRINRQYLVHIDSIATVHNYFNGKLKVELKTSPEAELIVSRKKATLLKAWLGF